MHRDLIRQEVIEEAHESCRMVFRWPPWFHRLRHQRISSEAKAESGFRIHRRMRSRGVVPILCRRVKIDFGDTPS